MPAFYTDLEREVLVAMHSNVFYTAEEIYANLISNRVAKQNYMVRLLLKLFPKSAAAAWEKFCLEPFSIQTNLRKLSEDGMVRTNTNCTGETSYTLTVVGRRFFDGAHPEVPQS